MDNNSNFSAATLFRDVVFHTIQTPTVCYSIPSIVEVSGGLSRFNKIAIQGTPQMAVD